MDLSPAAAAEAEKKAQDFIQEVWGLLAGSIAISGIRYYSRVRTVGWRNLAWDDFLMLLAIAVLIVESYEGYSVVGLWSGLANNGMTDEQRKAVVPGSEEERLRIGGSKTHVIGLILYTTHLWLLKGCWSFYYARLTSGVQDRQLLIKGCAIVMPATYIGCLLVAFFKCIPFHHQWQIYPNPGNNCLPAISTLQTIFVMVMNTVTDFYLMAIPVPMIYKTNMTLMKKITVMAMFSGALVEMSFGILRAVAILTVGDSDPGQSGYWSIRESFVSMTLTNLPMLYAECKRLYGHVKETTISGPTKGSSSSGHPGYRLGSYPASKQMKSMPNETTFDSKEQICIEDNERAASSGDDERSMELPKQHQRPNDIETGAAPRDTRRGSSAGFTSPRTNQIVVTTNYAVSTRGADANPEGLGTKARGYAL